MSHLFLKRFPDDWPALTPGARRRVKHDATVDETPRVVRAVLPGGGSGADRKASRVPPRWVTREQGSTCRMCRAPIERGSLRVGLLLQCHKGFKACAYVHGVPCLAAHPEARKLGSLDEFVGVGGLSAPARAALETAFAAVSGAAGAPGACAGDGEAVKVEAGDAGARVAAGASPRDAPRVIVVRPRRR